MSNLQRRLERLEQQLGAGGDGGAGDGCTECQCERPAITVNWDMDLLPAAGGERREVCAVCGKPYTVRVVTWDDLPGGGD